MLLFGGRARAPAQSTPPAAANECLLFSSLVLLQAGSKHVAKTFRTHSHTTPSTHNIVTLIQCPLQS